MITIRAGNGAIGICLLLLASGCSREQQDWRSAEAADSIDGYGQFIQRHPESELVTQARTRVAQLGEDRDWQRAGSADSVQSYRDFLAQHPNGKWAQEARIRIENFSLGEQTGTDAASRGAATGAAARSDGRANASSAAGANSAGPTAADAGGSAGAVGDSDAARAHGLAAPGEAAAPVARPGSAVNTSAARPGGARAANRTPGSSGSSGGASRLGAAGAGASGDRAGSFGIQLGAFSSEAAANNEWRSLLGRFGSDLQGLQEHIVAADTASGRVYRLQAWVGDETRARGICDSLRKRSQGCVAVLPH